MEVGIRELKRRLSDYVEQASRGEVIQITDRGRPKAILAPLPGRLRLEQGIVEGWIRPGDGKPLAAGRRRHRVDRTVADLMAEDRGE
ncbi:hypothetical protein BH20CHL6_BH20CHL6_16390 [soil metagenome]